MDSGFPPNTDLPQSRMSGPNTPTSVEMGRFPPTPGVPSDVCRFQIPSPHTPSAPPGKYPHFTLQVSGILEYVVHNIHIG